MQKKLTLSVEQNVIEQAKIFAQIHQTSISQIVEHYLESLVAHEQVEMAELGEVTQSLFGAAATSTKSGTINSSKDFRSYLADKKTKKYQKC